MKIDEEEEEDDDAEEEEEYDCHVGETHLDEDENAPLPALFFEEKENINTEDSKGEICYMVDGSISGTITLNDGTIIKFIQEKDAPFAKILKRKETWRRTFGRLNPFSRINKDKSWKEYFDTAMKKDKLEAGKENKE